MSCLLARCHARKQAPRAIPSKGVLNHQLRPNSNAKVEGEYVVSECGEKGMEIWLGHEAGQEWDYLFAADVMSIIKVLSWN
jgi:hypothetical protein